MKVVIIEDEIYSAEKLIHQLHKIDSSIEILSVLPSVQKCFEWFQSHPEPDLIFSDIQLEDQNSFEFFRQFKVHAPIIYTTAFDQYAIQAFKQNSIDYLLKPIDIDDLKVALEKYTQLEFRNFLKMKNSNSPKTEYKERFLVKKGNQLVIVKTEEISFFKSEQKITFLVTFDNQKLIVDQTLDQLSQALDPKKFFRISRSRLISIESIHKIHPHFNNRLRLDLNPVDDEEVFVSRERVQNFKDWLEF